MPFGYDQNGIYKLLPDGRVLRIQTQLYNTMLTLSDSLQDSTWRDAW